MFGIGTNRGNTVAFVVDIGTGSVACAVVLVHKNKEASTLLAAQRTFLPAAERSTEQRVAGLVEVLKTTATGVLTSYTASAQKTYGPVRKLYCTIRAPWTTSQTLHVEQSFEKEQRITDGLVADMAKKALADAQVDRATLFEASVSRVELNGYPTRKPAGKMVRHISVGVLASTVDQAVRQGIDGSLSALFPGIPPIWRSHTRAALSLLNELPEHSRNCVLVDISNDSMSIVTIRKSLLESQIQIPRGVQFLLDKVAPGKPQEETLSLLRMLEHDACSTDACEAVRTAMATAEPEIVPTLGEAFSKLSAARRLPSTIVLLAHNDLADWLAGIFGRIDLAPFTVTGMPFRVITLGPKDVGHWIVPDTGVVADAGLSFAGALVHIEAHESH